MINVLGAGFTVGELTGFGKKVPSGYEFMQFMQEKILKYSNEYPSSELSEAEFYELSSIYFEVMDHNDVNVKQTFKELFTNIYLEKISEKYKFLNLNWKTIYTLNIDDAIENNSDFNNIITPEINLDHNILSDYKSVIKLHGDAKQNIINGDRNLGDSIVFSKEVYMKALLENKVILSYFVSELSRLHTMFYGCSFETLEVDIEGIIASEKNDIKNNPDLRRFFITTSLPKKKMQIRKLEKDLLITDIVVLQKRDNYQVFLRDIVKVYNEISKNIKDYIGDYDEFLLNASLIDTDRNANIKFLLGLETIYHYNDYEFSKFDLPYYTIEREVENSFISTFSQSVVSIIKGRKISGKTTFILNAFKDYKNKKVYFIPSTVDISLDIFFNMLQTLKDSVIILDTNSFNYKHLWKLKDSLQLLKKHNVNVILIFNSFDNTTLGSFYSDFKENEYLEFELDSIFSKNELDLINKKLDIIPLPQFNNELVVENDFVTRRIKQNILDNIIRINITAYSDKKYINWDDYKIKKVKEFTLLFILSTLNKFNLSSYYLVYGGMTEIQKIIQKYAPFIEEEYLSKYEKEQYSGSKIVSNCQVCLTYILAVAIEEKIISINDITDELSRIIGKLYRNKIQKYQELLFFDNLQENLQNKHKKYLQEIVIQLYTKLEKELTSDKHYWLQRAKSILYMQSTDINAIKDGLRFSTKVYTDEVSKHNKISGYAAHITAMLYGRLISLEKYDNIDNIESAILFYYTILEEYSWNTKYIKNMVKRNKNNDLKELCFQYNDGFLNPEYREKLKVIREDYRSLS